MRSRKMKGRSVNLSTCKALYLGLALVVFSLIFSHNNVNVVTKTRKLEVTNTNSLRLKGISRSFESWDRNENNFPCVSKDTPSTQGIFYIKVPKTSSSTLAGITNRIAGREAKRQNMKECKTYDPMVHQKALVLDVGKRDRKKSFLWSVVRHPADRLISHYGMKIDHGQVEASETSFIRHVKQGHMFPPNPQLNFLTTEELSKLKTPDELASAVKSVLDEYNFIGVYERLYESLVVLSMLIGVEVSDVLFDFVSSKYSRCGSLSRPDWVTTRMARFVSQGQWPEQEKADFLLYDSVNQSLDMTIDRLGRETVAQRLEDFLKLIYIGSSYSVHKRKKTGCGIPDLHEKKHPFSDINELPWFSKISREDQSSVFSILNKSVPE